MKDVCWNVDIGFPDSLLFGDFIIMIGIKSKDGKWHYDTCFFNS